MKKIFLVVGLLLGTLISSQAQNIPNYKQENLLKAGLFGPSIVYELKLSNNTTVVAEAGVSVSFGYGGEQIGWLSDYALYTGVSPRFYYNFENRLDDDQSIKNFSGNFISLFTRAYLYEVLSSTGDLNQFLVGPTWGIQRNLGKGWYYNLQLGAGASITKQETVFTPLIGANIGFYL